MLGFVTFRCLQPACIYIKQEFHNLKSKTQKQTCHISCIMAKECHQTNLQKSMHTASVQLHKFKTTICKSVSDLGNLALGLGTHLFVKVPRPGDSKGTFSVFESSCHLLLPV